MNHGKPAPSMPKLSIVISTMNAARTLARCLDSIQRQRFPDYEVIMIDGGSTDTTAAVAARYASLISHFQSEPDTGIYDAWNKALRATRGEWLCFLGADDWFSTPDSLTQFAAAAASPGVTLVTARVDMADATGTVTRAFGQPWATRTMKKYMCIAHSGAWHHRSLFDTHGSFKAAYRLAGDYDFLLRSCASVRPVFIPKSLVTMELGGISDRQYWLHVRESYLALKASRPAGIFHAIRFLVRASIGRVLRKFRMRSNNRRR